MSHKLNFESSFIIIIIKYSILILYICICNFHKSGVLLLVSVNTMVTEYCKKPGCDIQKNINLWVYDLSNQ